MGSGETLGGSEARGPSSATRGGTPAARSAGVGCHVCKTSCPAALGGFLILQRSLGLSNIGRSQKCVISGSPADSVVKNLPANARATGSIQKDPARRGAAKCTRQTIAPAEPGATAPDARASQSLSLQQEGGGLSWSESCSPTARTVPEVRPRWPRKPGGGATASSLRAGEQGAPPGLRESWRVVGPGFLSSGSPGPKRGVREDIMHPPPHVARAYREKAHRTRRETRSHDTARGSQRKISRADGFQAKASEEYSSAARIPEPGPSGRCNREQAPPRKADAKAERSSQLPDDVKGAVDCGMEAGGEGWQRKGQGRESERHLEPGLGCHYPSWEVGATQML